MEAYNLDYLVNIRVIEARINPDYYWKSYRKGFLGIGKRTEGYYSWMHTLFTKDSQPVNLKEQPDNCFEYKGSIYWNPLVVLTFVNNDEKHIWFDDYENALKYAETIELHQKMIRL